MPSRRLLTGLLALTLALTACGTAPRGGGQTPPPPTSGGTPAPPVSPTPAPSQPWVDTSHSPFPVRGIIEGFYGTPWSHAERLATFDFMAKVGMNAYVYAPKDDPYQRARWREPYPDTDLAGFRELLDRAKQDHVDFVYSISPGLDITYGAAADRQALAAKVEQLHTLGIHTIMLSLDDVPAQLNATDRATYGNNYAAAQADLANWLHQHQRAQDPSFVLWVTPTKYDGVKATPYVTTMGQKLDKAIPILWTGPWVLSDTITAADADAWAAIVGRKSIVWDNYPVNDYTYTTQKPPKLFLGPLRGRAADLAGHVTGYLANPMNEATASQLPLYTAAAYLADPGRYNPEQAWRDAARHLTQSDAAATTLLAFAGYAQYSMLWPHEAPELTQALDDYRARKPGAAQALKVQLQRMSETVANLESAAGPAFYHDVEPWAAALADKAAAGLLALDVDTAVTQGDRTVVQARLPELKLRLEQILARSSRNSIAQTLVEDFMKQVIARAEPMAR